MERDTFHLVTAAWILLGLGVFIILLKIPAPYGRHSRADWGPAIPNRLAWFIMEFPSLAMFILAFLLGPGPLQPATWIFFALFTGHYTHRSMVYPWRTRTRGKQMPLLVALMAILFNLVNGYLNGYYFSAFPAKYSWNWLCDVRFIGGSLLFAGGVFLNWWSDQKLLRLREKGEKGYVIPRGGPFRWVSCPNFLGEIVEWSGFALMTWSPAALAFALWTSFNLVPRALDHHRWYRQRFADYPPERKAIIPFLL